MGNLSADMIGGMLVGGIFALTAVGSLVSLVMWILSIIGSWKMFGKMGEPGWKCLIPFYNTWVEYKHTWNPVMLFPAVVLSFAGELISRAAAEGSGLQTVAALLTLGCCIITWVGAHKLSKAFGHGVGFTLGLILFPGIFQIVLGFGESRFIGRDGIAEAPETADAAED